VLFLFPALYLSWNSSYLFFHFFDIYTLILYGGFICRKRFFVCALPAFQLLPSIFSYCKICFAYIFFFCSGVFILLRRFFFFIYNRSAILSHAVRLSLIISVFSVLLIWSNVNLFKYRFTGNTPVSAFNMVVWVARYTFVIVFKHLF